MVESATLYSQLCPRIIRRARRCCEWLIIGCPETLPSFIQKRHSGLVDTYERLVGILVDSFSADSASLPLPLASLVTDFQKIRNREGEFADRNSTDLRFKALLTIDSRSVCVIPDDMLRARRWLLIDRFRRIAPERAITLYEASNPPSLRQQEPRNGDWTDTENALLRADLISLTNYMQQLNITNVQREQALAAIKWWLVTRLLGLCGLIASLFAIITLPTPMWWPIKITPPFMLIGLLLVFLTGMTGAVTSIGRKFQDIAARNVLGGDPFNEIVALNSGRQSVALSIAVGGVFALLLYLLVMSGSAAKIGLDLAFFPSAHEQFRVEERALLGGQGTTPDGKNAALETSDITSDQADRSDSNNGPALVQIERRQDERVLPGIAAVSGAMGFFYLADILRMLLLAFIAGFAERLVPDAIDRLIRREKAAAGSV